MSTTRSSPVPEREDTDVSLRIERKKADDEIAAVGARVEHDADEVVRHAREQADKTLGRARARADAKLTSAGASSEVKATAHAEQETAEAVLAGERDTADRQLDKERAQRQQAIAKLLHLERAQTDTHLSFERARSDEGVMRLLAELAGAVHVRDEFLSLASHELRTPLSPLTLGLGVLERDVERNPDSPLASRVKAYVASARRQVERLSALVEHLLDVSQIAAGTRSIKREAVDFAVVVREVAARLQPRAEKAGCAFLVDVTSISGQWDALRLTQTVTKLLENAIKYGRGMDIRVRLVARSEKAFLTVEDQGIGIQPERLGHIFERFERAVAPGLYSGLGLGLYICRADVEAMGGQIHVSSELGRGTTFTVELPISGLPALTV